MYQIIIKVEMIEEIGQVMLIKLKFERKKKDFFDDKKKKVKLNVDWMILL